LGYVADRHNVSEGDVGRGAQVRLGAIVIVAAGAAILAGCASPEVARFQPTAGQEAIVRDGNPALVSRKAGSLVIARPATRQFQAGRRIAYVVGIYNLTRGNLLFSVSNVRVGQLRNGQIAQGLRVYTYEELAGEERNRQVARALFAGLAAGANSYSASRAGYYNSNATVYGPAGVSNVSITGYDPAAAVIAQSNAAAQNDAMIASTIERGRQNLDALEKSVIKDNTIFPGEWYGGVLVFDPPQGEQKNYRIIIPLGPDIHQIDVAQERVQS
jgi:hypothetical protein